MEPAIGEVCVVCHDDLLALAMEENPFAGDFVLALEAEEQGVRIVASAGGLPRISSAGLGWSIPSTPVRYSGSTRVQMGRLRAL